MRWTSRTRCAILSWQPEIRIAQCASSSYGRALQSVQLWMCRWMRVLALACCWLMVCASPLAWAHKGSDAYLEIKNDAQQPEVIALRWSVALKDIDVALPLDANADGKVTWGEVKALTPDILAWMQDGLVLQVAASATNASNSNSNSNSNVPRCVLDWRFEALERRSDGTYFQALARMVPPDVGQSASKNSTTQRSCLPAVQGWQLGYHLLEGIDDTHRLLIGASVYGQDSLYVVAPGQTISVSGGNSSVQATGAGVTSGGISNHLPSSQARVWATFKQYVQLGFTHLLTGYDHMAFLLALVLPLQLAWCWSGQAGQHSRRRWGFVGQPSAIDGANPAYTGAAGWRLMLTTVTAFTVGHSITLILATLGWVHAPASVVEPIIALSIGASAGLNFYRHHPVRPDVLALSFGLIHGLGFAGLLQEMQAPTGLLPWALAGFNVGVEVGQLIAVVVWVALSQAIVRRSWYHAVVVRGGSAALMVLSLYWVAQRVGLL